MPGSVPSPSPGAAPGQGFAGRAARLNRTLGRSASGEIAQLRAKIAELEAATDRQASAGLRNRYARRRRRRPPSARIRSARRPSNSSPPAIADVAATRADTIRRAEADTVRLAIEIARRVLHREVVRRFLRARRRSIKAALEKLQSQEIYRVRVHPDQEAAGARLLEQAGRGQAIEVIGDPVQPGAASFSKSAAALWTLPLDTQLAEIERGLIDQLEARA